MKLTPLNLPNAPLKLTRSGEDIYVVCLIRKKKLKLTPEEWVRQHVAYYLMKFKNYPEGLIEIEKGIYIHQLFRRCDLVLNDRTGKARVIVECKAPHVSVSQITFDQAAHYNQQLQVDYLLLTNGIEHQIFRIDTENKQLVTLEDLPNFEELISEL